jgi:beta-phosphoglucomutase-like phosphatase (HAD superfamily)
VFPWRLCRAPTGTRSSRRWRPPGSTIEDVARGKPAPESYLLALGLFDGDPRAEEVTVFEDTEAGVAAAKAAGMRCVAIPGTHTPERLALADELAPALDVEAVRRAREP